MPAVFVHGVPDTLAVWRHVLARLARRDIVALSLPGFGCPRPPGFAATKEAYVAWLVDELMKIEGPIDLVGHDWGSLLAMRAVMLRPDLVRSWAGGAAPVDSTYVWHEAARIFQTPGMGEQMLALMTGDAMREGLAAAGLSEADATATASHVDDTMKGCILDLYRSAVRVGAEWESDLGRMSAPGLVIFGERDPYVDWHFGERLAERTNARFVLMKDCRHWWQCERADEVARELEAHWSGAAARS
jgi:pimeloyl-ACP methyl ester carboxylesterase